MRYHHPVANYKHLSYPQGDVTQWFAENPTLYSRLGLAGHNGIDIVRPHGTALHAIEDAVVLAVNDDPGGFGKHIRLVSTEQNDDGTFNEWVYGHNSQNLVKVGQEVRGGEVIALMGNTGFVVSSQNANGFWNFNPYAGTHLHIGVRKVRRVKSGGWTYPESTIRISVQNNGNGFRGRIDPWRHLFQSGGNTTSTIRELRLTAISLLNSLLNKLQ